MKLLIGILILVELLLILGMACPIFVDNEDHARAVATYIQNPNPESLANLQDEKINRCHSFDHENHSLGSPSPE